MKPLKILLLSDEMLPERLMRKETFNDADLIISCGDLPGWYLSLVADLSCKDVLYVPGNHDVNYLKQEPEGCICIDDRLFTWNGITFLGLGGSHIYNGRPYQYTQKEMWKRFFKIRVRHPFSFHIDFLITHSPAKGINDGSDPCHTGFEVFHYILEKFKPYFFIHGHMHMNYGNYPRVAFYDQSTIINAYTSYLLEWPGPKSDRN